MIEKVKLWFTHAQYNYIKKRVAGENKFIWGIKYKRINKIINRI